VDWRNSTALDLIRSRWEAGRIERGLAVGAPFQWDNPELGVDELEELVDAWIYRRERYRVWYGTDESTWPYIAFERLQEATAAIESLRAELKRGPLGSGSAPETHRVSGLLRQTGSQ
jgi:hypothetical protein